jgi:hypothetical protein
VNWSSASRGHKCCVCEVETVDGSLLLQLMANAAHELNALLDRLPPRVTQAVSIKLFKPEQLRSKGEPTRE